MTSETEIDSKKAEAIGEVTAELVRRSVGRPRSDVAHLPLVLLERQQRVANVTGAAAMAAPARMAFAMAAAALGFVGDELPALLQSRESDYRIGAEIRRGYDAAMAAKAEPGEAPAP